MNVEFLRRETTKKIMGFTALPTSEATKTIAAGLDPIDFVGMVIETSAGANVITGVSVSSGVYTFAVGEDSYTYTKATGVLAIVPAEADPNA